MWFRRKKKMISNTITVEKSSPLSTTKQAKANGIKGAQWSALEEKYDQCELCKFLDGMKIRVEHPDFDRFKPPLHKGCKCMYIHIGENNIGEVYNWKTYPEELIKKYTDD